MDTYSTFKGLALPVLSALTFSSNGYSQLDVYDMNNEPLTTEVMNYDQFESYYSNKGSNSNKTYEVTSDAFDYMIITSFAERYIKNLTPIQDSIQAVIDDYFWEML